MLRKIRFIELREYLKIRNVSLTRFASEVGMSQFGLQRILNGKVTRPRDYIMIRMEEILGLKSGSDETGVYFYEPDVNEEEFNEMYKKFRDLQPKHAQAIVQLIDLFLEVK